MDDARADAPTPVEALRVPSVLPMVLVVLVVAAVVIGCIGGIRAALPKEVTLSDLEVRADVDHLPVRIDGYYYAVALGEAPEALGRRGGHYVAFGDASTEKLAVLALSRPPSPSADNRTSRIVETIEGTVEKLDASLRERLSEKAVENDIDLGDASLLVIDGVIPPFPIGLLILGMATTAAGVVAILVLHRHRQVVSEMARLTLPKIALPEAAAPPEPIMPGDTSISRVKDETFARATAQAPCGVCGATVMGFMKLCPNCKIPREVEHYVSAALPLQGFERLTAVVMRIMGESEYNAARTLARPHMPIPFTPIQGLKERYRGGQSESIHRLVARGHGSYIAAQSLKEELERQGFEAVLCSSEELARAGRPGVALSAEATLEGLRFRLEDGGVREVLYDDVYLVLVYGEESTAETVTRGGRDASSGSGPHVRRNLLDIYARAHEGAVRIHSDRFGWDVLGERRAASPEANFGQFTDMLESRCGAAVFHFVTDTHAGAWSEWRATYYSLWRSMVSRRGADKGRGQLSIEGYRILKEVGKGAWGQVYQAVQERVERVVAIKVLSSQFPRDEKFRERFLREARTAARLNHPNVVAVIDCNEQRGLHYLVMEFVEGMTMKQVVKARGPLPERQALLAAKAVSRALEHAHGKSIVHRDIKPENIFLSKDGHVKLGDWGLAKSYVSADANLTETGAAMGTPNYISPEQVKALKEIDWRADIYSLGATLYYLLAGSPPFQAPTVVEIMTRHLKDTPPDVRQANAAVSPAAGAIITRCMAKKPEDRYQSAAEMAAAIDEALAALPA